MKFLVTGATGNVGREVVKELFNRGASVRATVRSKEKARDLLPSGVELVNMEFDQPDSIQQALNGVDKAILITPVNPNMVDMSMKFVEQAKNTDIKHIVKLSGMGAQMEAITLAKWHREVEKAIEKSGIQFTFLRPNSFMQNYVNYFGDSIRMQGAFYLPLGNGKVSLVDTRDIAAVTVEVLLNTEAHHGKAYDITGGEAYLTMKLPTFFLRSLNKTVQYVDISEEDARAALQQNGMPDIMVQAMLELYPINKDGYTAEISPVVQQVTGKQPITFREFATDYSNIFK